ncbi:hypothetical protein SAMN02927924_00109 [Sphingobium faniae]|nr:hypothetical protein SAMN02927924_00109 [Sphingobium faniae]
MDDFALARVLHVVAVLLWIGGVAFVTLVAMPSVRAGHEPGERLAAFHDLEGRFAPQARWWVLIAGASGLWMTWRAQMWDRFADPHYWWMHAMLVLWLLFAAMLFVVEPLFLHRRMKASADPAADFARMERMHRIALAASIVTVAGAVGGSHGLF